MGFSQVTVVWRPARSAHPGNLAADSNGHWQVPPVRQTPLRQSRFARCSSHRSGDPRRSRRSDRSNGRRRSRTARHVHGRAIIRGVESPQSPLSQAPSDPSDAELERALLAVAVDAGIAFLAVLVVEALRPAARLRVARVVACAGLRRRAIAVAVALARSGEAADARRLWGARNCGRPRAAAAAVAAAVARVLSAALGVRIFSRRNRLAAAD
jgi:hypothetical protein